MIDPHRIADDREREPMTVVSWLALIHEGSLDGRKLRDNALSSIDHAGVIMYSSKAI